VSNITIKQAVVGNITVKDLSPDQLAAYNSIMGWVGRNPAPVGGFDDEDDEDDDEDDKGYSGPPAKLLTLGGYAGTGKSTLVSLIAEQVDLPAFCAYTGKATSVLRRKLHKAGTETVGTQRKSRDGEMSREERPYCGTIHSLIYRPCDCREPGTVNVLKPCPDKDCPGETRWENGQSVCAKGHVGFVETAKAFEALKPKKKFVYAEKVDGRCKLCGGKEWLRRESLDRHYSLIIVDEASMVDDMMLRDLREYGVPILAVGDHGQLPPVGGVGSLMKAPNLRLEKIHRQAEGNPIIALSKIIRETGLLPENMPESEAVHFGKLRFVDQIIEERYGDASAARLLEMGLACYTNKRRIGLNVTVRRVRGTARNGRELPRAGEHVVCLRNMKEEKGRPPVANGMRGVLQSDATPKQTVNSNGEKLGVSETQLTGSIAFPEDEIAAYSYDMLRAQFGREKTFSSPEELAHETGLHSFAMAGALFDYGFAMTVHKMQGSQFDDLVVCAERPGPVDQESWRRWLYTAVTRAANKLTVLR
jgi:exodeoxyribonuclease-5